VGQFNVAMRRQLAIMRDQPGLVYVKLARRLEVGGGELVLLFEEWRDPDSVYAWAGDDLSRPRLLPAAADAAAEITVTHYEALDAGLEEDLVGGGSATGGEGVPGGGAASGPGRVPGGGQLPGGRSGRGAPGGRRTAV
jgi:hypothetical protein